MPRTVPVQITASNNAIGQIGTITVSPGSTPTMQAAAYAAGQVIGGLQTLTSAVRSAQLSGNIQSVVITSATAQMASTFDVIYFNANPTASTITDKTNLSIATADLGKVIGVAPCNLLVSAGVGCIAIAQNLSQPFVVPSGTSIYAAIVLRTSGATFGSTSDLTIKTIIVQD